MFNDIQIASTIRVDGLTLKSVNFWGFYARVLGAPESFQIFRQNTWFLEKNRALSKFFQTVWEFPLYT